MTPSVAAAPGKIILLGEHAVVYGQPALALPVFGRRAEATVAPAPGGTILLEAPQIGETWTPGGGTSRLAPLGRMVVEALRRFGAERLGLTARLHATIPLGGGMGSSAAVAVALLRALAVALGRDLRHHELVALAMVAEAGFHGNPSGIDAEVVSRERPVFFTRAEGARPVRAGRSDFHWVIADSGVFASTADVVGDVAAGRRAEPGRYERIFGELGALARAGRRAIETGGPEDLGPLMDRAQDFLVQINVSSPEIDRLVTAARQAGALGAKLSGAGRGGHIIALAAAADRGQAVEEACRRAGAADTCRTELVRHHAEAAP